MDIKNSKIVSHIYDIILIIKNNNNENTSNNSVDLIHLYIMHNLTR